MSSENIGVVQEVEQALAIEREVLQKRSEERLNAVVHERDKISRVGSFLRYIGVAVLMAAMGVFMFQRWEGMTHVSRYFTFLAFTGGVCVSGLLCGLKIGENKGARTLLGVVVMLIPLHCAQIGALLYSRLGADVDQVYYPRYFYLSAPTLSDAVLAAAGGLLALIPMAYMAYSVLARTHARQLLLVGCGISGALLVPTRDPSTIAGLIVILGVVAYLYERYFASVSELKTFEGFVARAVPFLAIAMLVGRQSAIYHPTRIFEGVVYGLLTAVTFGIIPRMVAKRGVVWAAEFVSLFTAAIATSTIVGGIADGFKIGGPLGALVVGLPFTIVFAAMSRYARETKQLFGASAAGALFLTGYVQLLFGGVAAPLSTLVIGILAISYACVREHKAMLVGGGSLIVAALVRVSLEAVASLSMSPWLLMGVVGVLTIVGASYIERNFVRIRDGLSTFRKQVASWS